MPLCYPLPHTGDRPFCEVYGKNNIYLDFVALIIASETLHKPCEKIFLQTQFLQNYCTFKIMQYICNRIGINVPRFFIASCYKVIAPERIRGYCMPDYI